MAFNNVEIKARSNNAHGVREYLRGAEADSKGTDHQIDTYYKTDRGRLKLRKGNIENNLIFYERSDQSGPKQSKITFSSVEADSQIDGVLAEALGVFAVVDKKREIYFIDNVKFHIDTVEGLGNFIEIEAIDYDGTLGPEKLQQQCEYYMRELGIKHGDLLTNSYSDMIIGRELS